MQIYVICNCHAQTKTHTQYRLQWNIFQKNSLIIHDFINYAWASRKHISYVSRGVRNITAKYEVLNINGSRVLDIGTYL